jgi:hypothetical protein
MASLRHRKVPPEGPEAPPVSPPSQRGFYYCRLKRPRPVPPFKNDGQGRRGQVVRRLPSSGEQLSKRRRLIGGGNLVRHKKAPAEASARAAMIYCCFERPKLSNV